MIEYDWLKKWSLYSPQKVALVDGDNNRSFTYQQLYIEAQKGAAFLSTKYKIHLGDRIAVFSTNEVEYLILFFALQRLGATIIPINVRLTAPELSYILKNCEPKLVLFEGELQSVLDAAEYQGPKQKLYGENSFAEALKCGNDLFTEFLTEEMTPTMILYTSGTTGFPKGAIISQKMIFWNSLNTFLRLNISQNDAAVIFLPFFHTGAWHVLTTPFIHHGAKIILTKKFDAEKVLSLTAKESCTLLFGVPTTMDMMVQTKIFEDVDLSSLRYAIVGGEPMPIPLIEKWQKKGIPIRQGYGLTEFGPNVFSLNEEDAIRKRGSIGFENFYVQAKVVDENGIEVLTDEVGELVLRGPMIMSGYWNNSEATAETIKDGWLHTGDLVRKDSEGFYFVVGRKKDMFKSGGENVYPPEIEQVIRTLDGIREVAVIGVKDQKWGEVGYAFLVKDRDQIDESVLLVHCKKNLAKFKIPKYFKFVDALPKGDSGKILKKNLVPGPF